MPHSLQNQTSPRRPPVELALRSVMWGTEPCPRAFAGRPSPPRINVCGNFRHGGGYTPELLELHLPRLSHQTRSEGFLLLFLPGDPFLLFGEWSPWGITDTKFTYPSLKILPRPGRPQSCWPSRGASSRADAVRSPALAERVRAPF